MELKKKALVVGCGSIGLRHLRTLVQRGDLKVAAADVSAPMAQPVAEISSDILFFDDVQHAFNWQPDYTIVASPNAYHEQHSCLALQAGSHVLCEKPIAETDAAGERMLHTARTAQRCLQIGYTYRYKPSFIHLLAQVKQQSLGRIFAGRALVGSYHTLLCGKSPFREQQFGVLVHDYTHQIDLLAELLGQVCSVSARANTLAKKERRSYPSAVGMLLGYRSGAFASIHLDYVQQPERADLELYGDRQSVRIDLLTDELTMFSANTGQVEKRQFPCERDELFRRQHQCFFDAASGKKPQWITMENSLAVLRVANQAIAQLQAQWSEEEDGPKHP